MKCSKCNKPIQNLNASGVCITYDLNMKPKSAACGTCGSQAVDNKGRFRAYPMPVSKQTCAYKHT